MNIFLNIFKHLLPRSKAWRITIDKTLRRFFDGLSIEPENIKVFFEKRFLDVFPSTTTAVSEFLEQFNLKDTGSDSTNRMSIAAAWRLNKYQSETDIQNTLQAAGFDVYVHEWWQEPVVGSPVPVDPIPLIGGTSVSLVQLGEPNLQLGEPFFQLGNFNYINGRALVNKNGETPGQSYVVPNDPLKWPYFIYIGAATFPNDADISVYRKEEFETLLLKITPMQQWIGLLVDYVIPPQPPIPRVDTLLNPLPNPVLNTSNSGYLTFSQISTPDNIVVDGWGNHIGAQFNQVTHVDYIEYNDNETPQPHTSPAIRTYSDSVLYTGNASGNGISSGPTAFIVFNPDFLAQDIEYNLIGLGTNNDVHVGVTYKSNGNIEYHSKRRDVQTLEVPYTPGQICGVGVVLNKTSTLGGQRIMSSDGSEIIGANGQIGTGAGSWGLFPQGGRDYINGVVLEVLIIAPFQTVNELNRIMAYLNAKWNLSFSMTT